MPAVAARCGEQSTQYAALLIQLGDARMMRGSLANPRAQASYEAALEILQNRGGKTSEIARVYDRLASVKQSSGDSLGAAADLKKALGLWNEETMSGKPGENYLARRAEDLQRLKQLNAFEARKPPEIEPGR